MSELTDAHLTGLFANLRSDELALVRPPGANVARATVRRRRTTTVALLSAAVVGVAGVAGMGLGGGRPADDAGQAASRATFDQSVQSQEVLADWRDQAGAVLGFDKASPPSDRFAARMILANEFVAATPVVAGTYWVSTACVGVSGATIVVTHTTASGSKRSTWSDSVPCLPTARTTILKGVVVTAGNLSISVLPDAAAKGWAGFAYKIRMAPTTMDALVTRAKAALAISPAKDVIMSVSGFNSDEYAISSDHRALSIGKYRLDVACAGSDAGSIEAQVGIRLRAIGNFTCHEQPQAQSVTFTLAKDELVGAGPLMVDNVAAKEQTAIAYRVTRI